MSRNDFLGLRHHLVVPIVSVGLVPVLLAASLLLSVGFTHSAQASPSGFSDDFYSHSSLNTAIWSTSNAGLLSMAQSYDSQFVPPSLGFSSSGMSISGPTGLYQVTGIESLQSFGVPLNTTATVEAAYGTEATFELLLANANLSNFLSVTGDYNSGYFGVWYNNKSDSTLGTVFYASPQQNTWYTINIDIGANGYASIAFTLQNGTLLGSLTNIFVGSGPFYITLAQRIGAPYGGPTPQEAIWNSVSVSGATSTPTPTLTSIAVTPASPANLTVGSTQQFTATGTYSDGSNADVTSHVTWSSDNTSVASTSSSGLATGMAMGSTTITASLAGVTSNSVTLTITLASPSLSPLKVIGLPSISPEIPQAGQEFTVSLLVENDGDVPVESPASLSIDGTDPSVDPTNQTPTLISQIQDPQSIPKGSQATLVYSCYASFSFAAPPTLLATALQSYVGLAASAASDIAGAGILQYAGHTLGLNSVQYTAFKDGYEMSKNILGGAQEVQDGLGGVLQMAVDHQLLLGVNFGVSLVPQGQGTGEPISILVVAPNEKFVEASQWIGAKVAAVALSASLSAAGAIALVPSTTGVLAPASIATAAVLFGLAAVIGPATDAWYQHELSDPSQDFTQMVTVSAVPSIILSAMSNGTGGRALYLEYEYKTYLDASVESSARGYAALGAQSAYWANLQYEKAYELASEASSYFNQMQSNLAQLVDQLRPSMNQVSFDKGIDALQQEEVWQDVNSILQALGVSELSASSTNSLKYQSLHTSDLANLPDLGQYLRNDAKLKLKYMASPGVTQGKSLPLAVIIAPVVAVLVIGIGVGFLIIRKRKSTSAMKTADSGDRVEG